jgi:hypothetical protein
VNEELMPDQAYLYPYQYSYEPPLPYPAQYQPAAWQPLGVYQPLFWAALLGGIVEVAGAIILGSQAFTAAKKVLKRDGEEKP